MRMTEDTWQHKGMRRQLVAQLKEKGISDQAVLDAIGAIPRHYFLDSAFDKIAYEDRAFPIAEGQTISQPYTVAYQTQLLQVSPGQKVLEIGTGSMYQATVLAEMKAQVFTIERQRRLFDMTKDYLFKKKYTNLRFFFGDGYLGLPAFAPYDRILITAAAPAVPEGLITQLKTDGMMVVPVDDGLDVQRMVRVTKHGDGPASEESFDHFSFVPMLKGKSS